MCIDSTRVRLKPWPEGQGDFIHANWIINDLLDCPFICTQGPLNETCGDFWRMVWQEKVELIIMLCRTLEENRNKCAQYWPLNVGQLLTFCGITIRAVQKRTNDPDVHSTALLLTYRGIRRPLAHYQWVSWPDKFVPNQLTVPFTLLSSARARKTPTIIHCSAGIGRTGTLVVLELLARTLLSCRLPVVSDIIWSVRSQRSRAVQNEEQYLYIHYLTIQRLVNKGIVPNKAVSKFCHDYEQFYFTRTHRKQIPLPIYDKTKKALPKKSITPEQGTTSKKQIPSTSNGTRKSSSTTSTDSKTVQQQVTKKKATIRKKATARSSDEIIPLQQQSSVIGAKLSQSQSKLQQEYQEAQKALLEEYCKERITETKSSVCKQEQKGEITEANTVRKDDQTEGKSVYAFLNDEVRKIKQMEENPVPKGEVDTADYVFMQPIYARTYGATGMESQDIVEKYMMNMLPEEYFDKAMDDGAEYVATIPINRENTESNEKLQKKSKTC